MFNEKKSDLMLMVQVQELDCLNVIEEKPQGLFSGCFAFLCFNISA